MKMAFKVLKGRYFKTTNLINVCYFVTYRCNAECLFCDLGNKKLQKPEMTLSQAKQMIGELKSVNVQQVSLVGGEPVLRSDLPEIISCCKDVEMRVAITTNGFLFRKAVIKGRPDEINISLDFPDHRHGEYRRVHNGFSKVCNTIGSYVKYKKDFAYSVGINIVLMRENLDSLEDIMRLARATKVDKVNIQPLFWSQVRKKDEMDSAFTEAELTHVEAMLHHMKEMYGDLLSTSKLFLSAIPDYLRGPQRHKLFCFSGSTYLRIDPAGEVHPCTFMESAGNLMEKPLIEILKSRKYTEIHARAIKRRCPDCLCPDFFEPNLLCHPLHWKELFFKLSKMNQF